MGSTEIAALLRAYVLLKLPVVLRFPPYGKRLCQSGYLCGVWCVGDVWGALKSQPFFEHSWWRSFRLALGFHPMGGVCRAARVGTCERVWETSPEQPNRTIPSSSRATEASGWP